jgi:hypothetical protein
MSFNIGFAIWAEVGSLLCPRSQGIGLMIYDLLDPSIDEWFPNLPDLVRARSDLKWHVLAPVEPRGAMAVVHVGKNTETVGIEKFGYGGNV